MPIATQRSISRSMETPRRGWKIRLSQLRERLSNMLCMIGPDEWDIHIDIADRKRLRPR